MKQIPFCGRKAQVFLFFYKMARKICLWISCKKPVLEAVKELGEAPKILLSAWGSLGDVLLATTVIPKIVERYPKACIGFACELSGVEVVAAVAPEVRIHPIPNWRKKTHKGIRILLSWLYHRFWIYPKIAVVLSKESYDVSLELRLFFPTSTPVMRLARVSRRVGFRSGGFEEELTEMVLLPDSLGYLPLLYERLLKRIDISPKGSILFSPRSFLASSEEIIFHLGTSDDRKEWNPLHWRQLACELKNRGYELSFTGSGSRENRLIEQTFAPDQTILGKNLCNTLSFREFIERIRRARMVISVDSVSVHIAACFGVPFVALYLYNESLPLWIPQALSENIQGRVLVEKGQEIGASDVLTVFNAFVSTLQEKGKL